MVQSNEFYFEFIKHVNIFWIDPHRDVPRSLLSPHGWLPWLTILIRKGVPWLIRTIETKWLKIDNAKYAPVVDSTTRAPVVSFFSHGNPAYDGIRGRGSSLDPQGFLQYTPYDMAHIIRPINMHQSFLILGISMMVAEVSTKEGKKSTQKQIF